MQSAPSSIAAGAPARGPCAQDRSIGDTSDMSGNGRGAKGPNLVDLVIISGLFGAGKSSAMNVFEDAGYFCLDNLPAEMLRELAALFMHEGSRVERAAVVSTSAAAIAIGCTGGRHRSVVIAERLGAHSRRDGEYFVEVQHRDVDRAPFRAQLALACAPGKESRDRVPTCPCASASMASAASAPTCSARRGSRRRTSRSSPSTTSPTPRPSRTRSSTTRSTWW